MLPSTSGAIGARSLMFAFNSSKVSPSPMYLNVAFTQFTSLAVKEVPLGPTLLPTTTRADFPCPTSMTSMSYVALGSLGTRTLSARAELEVLRIRATPNAGRRQFISKSQKLRESRHPTMPAGLHQSSAFLVIRGMSLGADPLPGFDQGMSNGASAEPPFD